jgi:pyruvate dehydrogenase E2 component (dihydrolipoamide acetyltransferase)
MTDHLVPPMEQDGPRSGRLVAPSRMRRAIAQQMTRSKQTVPHFYVSTEIQMDAVLAALRGLAGPGAAPRVSVTACLIHALAESLIEHPEFNAVWTPDGLVLVKGVHIGVAVALEDGLIAPALLDCNLLDLAQTAAALEDLVSRTRAGRLRAVELASPTFTLSNLGVYDVASFAAIVIPPQVAILATGRAIKRGVAIGDEVVVRSVMTATLSADHRAVDGAQAARFLASVKARLEGFGWDHRPSNSNRG